MKLLKNTVTIYTVAFNGYWQKYGAAWTAHIKNLDPAPTEVIVVCDEPIDTEFKLIIETDKCISSFRNAAIKSATSNWVVLCDIDDTPLTNFIDDLDYNFDIIAYTLIDQFNNLAGGRAKWWNSAFLLKTGNPINASSAVKREILQKTLFRKVGWEDWLLWLDLKKNGATVKFDSTVRLKYNYNPTSYSNTTDGKKNTQEIREIKSKEFLGSNS